MWSQSLLSTNEERTVFKKEETQSKGTAQNLSATYCVDQTNNLQVENEKLSAS